MLQSVVDHLKKYYVTHATLITALVYFLMPSLQNYVAAHPNTAVGSLMAAVLYAFHASAPKDKD